MHIEFAEQDRAYLKSAMKNGAFKNEADVVRNAIRDLRTDEEKAGRLTAALEEARQERLRGDTEPVTEALMTQLLEEGLEHARKKMPYDSDLAMPNTAHE